MPTEIQEGSRPSYEGILTTYEGWAEEPEHIPPGWAQRRGYAFEKMMNALFSLEDLAPRMNYRPAGEEVDGSLVVDHRTHLLEFKWWKTPLPASQLYAFKGKLDGKLTGTIGICISHSGFAEDAIDALKVGKEINMILFDSADLLSVLNRRISFVDAVRKKLRYAAEYGQPYVPLFPDGPTSVSLPSMRSGATQDERVEQVAPVFDVVVESSGDEAALRELVSRLDKVAAGHVRIWRAGGARNLTSLASALVQNGSRHVALFVDGEDQTEIGTDLSLQQVAALGVQVVVFESTFVDLLEDACDVDYYNAVPPTGIREKHARRMARHADLAAAFKKNPALETWWRSVSEYVHVADPAN